MRRAVVIAGSALALALAAGAGGAEAPAVTLKLFQFHPRNLAVRAGTTVTWTSGDDIVHTVTAGEPGKPDGRFDLSLRGAGATGAIAFTEPGVYPYHCRRHLHMRGEIRVQ